MHQHIVREAFLEPIQDVMRCFACRGIDRAVNRGCNIRKPILPSFMKPSCKVAQDFQDFPVSPFNKAIGSRMVCRNKRLLNVKFSIDILKDLVLEFCSIVTEENTSVGADEIRNNGMSHCRSLGDFELI